MKFFTFLILFTVLSGCCQQKAEATSKQETSLEENTNNNKETKTEEEIKQEQFEKDVDWIYSYTLQHSYNPAKEDQVEPKEKASESQTDDE